ncbi:hypothetical protein BR93DRAFT_931771 [Coniochaeta sp. PMI_546]|nr:hypothetical protein BR93DRAFT_931771 [Coniochaeta sp. PMI_546]
MGSRLQATTGNWTEHVIGLPHAPPALDIPSSRSVLHTPDTLAENSSQPTDPQSGWNLNCTSTPPRATRPTGTDRGTASSTHVRGSSVLVQSITGRRHKPKTPTSFCDDNPLHT